ncbi:MAG: class I SAM-dependent rRNA methyltransferase [Planctomycetales bacterium]|nr:class I SAM-dependent rRNA methyltransferase [Planctomycetales bacterium]
MLPVRNPQLFLNVKKAKNFNGYHPWVLNRSIIEPSAPLEAGQVSELLFSDGRWIGRGVYNPHSRIRLRLYQWDPSLELTAEWCTEQLSRAIALRETWSRNHEPLDAVRLVNSEGDGLSGLIIDRFGDYLVVQVTALAMLNWLTPITDWLAENLQPRGILLRMDPRTAANEGMEAREETLWGEAPAGPLEIVENGVRIQLDLVSGQKTGYYLDQRSNRLKAARWVGPGPMLDVCSYLGGFSLAAARWGQPQQITAVDSSARALEQAAENAKLNDCNTIDFVQADCFDYLETLRSEQRKFQTVVLDPPRMASNRNQLPAALRAYYRLNLSAVNLLEPGGMLITCSCSGRVGRSDFMGMLASVARRAGRAIQIVENLGADFDHPIDASCPESEYLKCFICRVG